MDQKAREAMEKVDSCCDGLELFRIAKQRVGEKKDVGVSCIKDESGAVKVNVDDQKKSERSIWKIWWMLKMNEVIALVLVR